MNKEIRQLEQQNMDAVTRMSELQLKKENLYKQRNSITDSFFKRIFQRNKLKQLDSEIKDTFNEQENYRFEISDINMEMESLILQEKLDNNIREVTERLEVEGLYLSSPISSLGEIRDEKNITLETAYYVTKEFGYIPSMEDILMFASENDLITQVNKEEMVKLERELDKANLQVDDFPYSYSTSVSSVFDNGETLYVNVYDDTDAPFTELYYDGEENKWKNNYYSLSVDNPVESIKEKYSGKQSSKTTSERVSQLLNTVDLTNLSEDKEPKERQRLIEDTLKKFSSAQINFINTKFDKEELDLFINSRETGIEESYAEVNYFESQFQSTFNLEKEIEKTIAELESVNGLPDKMNIEIENIEGMMTTKEKDQANYVLMNVEEFEFKNALKAIQKLPDKDLNMIAKEKAQENKDRSNYDKDSKSIYNITGNNNSINSHNNVGLVDNSINNSNNNTDISSIVNQRVQNNKEKLATSFDVNYGKFLMNETISKKEQVEMKQFDKSQSDFDKVNRRLEVLEKVKEKISDKEYVQKDVELSGIKGNENKLKDVLSNEYTQMNRQDKHRTQAMKNMSQQQAFER